MTEVLMHNETVKNKPLVTVIINYLYNAVLTFF